MKSSLIPAADEEEGAALVPLPAAGAAPCKVVDDDNTAVGVERQSSSSSSSPARTKKTWWWTALVSPTRGAVGMVIGGLVVLAMLVGTTWIDLDAVSIYTCACHFFSLLSIELSLQPRVLLVSLTCITLLEENLRLHYNSITTKLQIN
jgi:hypothetical protein